MILAVFSSLLAPLCFSLFSAQPDVPVLIKKADAALRPAGKAPGDLPESSRTLFPDLEVSRLRSLSVSTPERSFEFRRNAPGEVSVNGHKADKEIFLTLISQIEELPVDSLSGAASTGKPTLTLVISMQDGRQRRASFFSGSGANAQVHITDGADAAPTYHQTDAWRVGTLMMTCEGTLIQDESGNETPL